MVQAPTAPKSETLLIKLPTSITLSVTQEQFAALAVANRDLQLERTSQGELIVNPPTGDASWVSRERWEALTPEDKATFPNICPDFVVELRSNSDSLKSLQDKMREYIENGAKLGWLIDPQQRRVEIYRQKKEPEVLENSTQLSGETVLPQFTLNLKRILH